MGNVALNADPDWFGSGKERQTGADGGGVQAEQAPPPPREQL